MLKINKLIEDVEEKYIPMLKKVNIVDFTKCIAEFSGYKLNEISDEVIKNYLLTWAKNKYKFYLMLNEKLRVDKQIFYKKQRENLKDDIKDLNQQFPVFAPWLDYFQDCTSNKIDEREVNWQLKKMVRELFPKFLLSGSTITHFFKKELNAPDELITKIGRIFENDKVTGIHTISIDPVDMMLASENPYDWQSCYRLETFNECSHADGCLAAVLDTSSLITYIWSREGEYCLGEKYKFKSIRYKKMRQWIAINDKMTIIHFNDMYPQKGDMDDELLAQFRDIVETFVANYAKIENRWKHGYDCGIERCYQYGYSEYSYCNLFKQSDAEDEEMKVYDEPIECPCGCGEILTGSDEGFEYIGEGFHHDCFRDSFYCELCEDYCEGGSCTEECCCGCSYWEQAHPSCSLEPYERCSDPDSDYTSYDGIMEATKEHCSNCTRWIECHKNDEE